MDLEFGLGEVLLSFAFIYLSPVEMELVAISSLAPKSVSLNVLHSAFAINEKESYTGSYRPELHMRPRSPVGTSR